MLFGAELRATLAALNVLLVLPWRCNLALTPPDNREPASSAATAKQEALPGRVSAAPPPAAPPVRAVTLPEEVVVKAMAAGQQTFLRCWARAQRSDPGLFASKVRLHIELDERGKVTSVHSDTESDALARCLAVVARQLPFPAPGQPAVVDLPLMFR
jgi:hypothetical protein